MKAYTSIVSELPGDRSIGLPTLHREVGKRIDGLGPEHLEYGLFVDGACLRFEGLTITGCYIGVVIKWAVDVVFRDCVFSRNACNIYIPGNPTYATTTLRFENCQIREAYSTGALLQSGHGIVFAGCIIESNQGPGLVAQPRAGHALSHLTCRDCWFENNGEAIVDPSGLLTLDRTWVTHRVPAGPTG